jgi:hypothetical protein
VIQLFAYDTAKNKTCLGQVVRSLLDLIQSQTLQEKNERDQEMQNNRLLENNKNISEADLSKIKSKQVDVKQVMLQNQLKQFDGCSDRMRKLYEEQYKSFQDTQDMVEEEEKSRMSRSRSVHSESGAEDARSEAGSADGEAGENFKKFTMNTEGITGKEDDNVLGGVESVIKIDSKKQPIVSVKLDWNFGFMKGYEADGNFLFKKEQERQLKILKEERAIDNILKNLNIKEKSKEIMDH